MRLSGPLLTTTCLLAACLAAPIQSNQSIVFKDCAADLGAPPLQCGSLEVPLDWDNPANSKTITIGVTKIPARKPSQRIGPLLYQPGGPGVLVSSQIAGILTGENIAKGEILDAFDFIGIDLRGSGLSTPITCDSDLWNAREPFFASTPKSYDALVQHNLAVRQSCINMTGSNLIDYMDSISIAHDYEAVRQALGSEKYTWLGQSYGTLLGSQYAELYAENLRGMILDGSVSNSQAETAQVVQAGESSEATMNYFFAWCEQQNATICPAAHQNGSKSLSEIWDDLIAKAEKSYIPTKGCASSLNGCPYQGASPNDLRAGALELLYSEGGSFPILAQGFYAAAFQDNAVGLLEFTQFVQKGSNTYNASQLYAENAIGCQDFAHLSSATEMFWWQQIGENDMPLLAALSPSAYFVHECVGWPQPKRNPPHAISIPNTLEPTILMVTNFHDPATPLAWSVQLQKEIGEDRAVLIERQKGGHTVYFERQAFDGPTLAAMNHYLLTLEVPVQRTVYPN